MIEQEIERATAEAGNEMYRQMLKWGVQNHASFNGNSLAVPEANLARRLCDENFSNGSGTWTDIFLEEVLEAIDEAKTGNLEALREELIQCAAVALSWAMSIDRNKK